MVAALPKFKPVDVATIPKSAFVGRFRSRDLCIDLVGFLVHGDDTGHCDISRSKQIASSSDGVWVAVPGVDGFVEALVGL